MYLAYKARNKDFWLSGGNALPEIVDPSKPVFFDLPVDTLVGTFVFEFADVGAKGLRGRSEGRNTAAQRSNSLQSKYDFASRYLLSSRVSRRDSSGSMLDENMEGAGVESASCIAESESEKDGLLEDGAGREAESSAALETSVRQDVWEIHWGSAAPLGGLIKASFGAFDHSILKCNS